MHLTNFSTCELIQVIGLRDVIPPPLRREFTDVYIATELMDTDLHQIIRSNQGLSEEHCQVINLFVHFSKIQPEMS